MRSDNNMKTKNVKKEDMLEARKRLMKNGWLHLRILGSHF